MQRFGNTSVTAAATGPILWGICKSQLLTLQELSYPSCVVLLLPAGDLVTYYSSSQESRGNIWIFVKNPKAPGGVCPSSAKKTHPGLGWGWSNARKNSSVSEILCARLTEGLEQPFLPALLRCPSWWRGHGCVSLQTHSIGLARKSSTFSLPRFSS